MIFLWLWTCPKVSRDVREIKFLIFSGTECVLEPLFCFGFNFFSGNCLEASVETHKVQTATVDPFKDATSVEALDEGLIRSQRSGLPSYVRQVSWIGIQRVPTYLPTQPEARYILPLDSEQCHSRVCSISSNYACLLEALHWEVWSTVNDVAYC